MFAHNLPPTVFLLMSALDPRDHFILAQRMLASVARQAMSLQVFRITACQRKATVIYCVAGARHSLPHVPQQYPQHEARELPFQQGLPSQDDEVKRRPEKLRAFLRGKRQFEKNLEAEIRPELLQVHMPANV
jgi:hypothetical protein